VWAERTVVEC